MKTMKTRNGNIRQPQEVQLKDGQAEHLNSPSKLEGVARSDGGVCGNTAQPAGTKEVTSALCTHTRPRPTGTPSNLEGELEILPPVPFASRRKIGACRTFLPNRNKEHGRKRPPFKYPYIINHL